MRTRPTRLRHRAGHRVAVRVLLALAVAGLAPLIGAAPASAAALNTGWIRLAHLSPDTPKVDVYLTSFAQPSFRQILRGVGYGALSPYEQVTAGFYTVSMRGQGAAPDSPPVISTNVQVGRGAAYTVAGVGRMASLKLQVLTDKLVPPPAGDVSVRVIAASSNAPMVDVGVVSGPSVAAQVGFASTTDYQAIPAGKWTLQVKPTQGSVQPITQTVNLAAGGIYSLLVLDQGRQAIQLLLRTDAAGPKAMPVGAVETGAGGSYQHAGSRTAVALAVLATALLVLGTPVRALRRRRATAAAH